MFEPFNAEVDFIYADRQSSSECTQTDIMSSGRDHMLGNGDLRPWLPQSDNKIRHELQGGPLQHGLISEDLNRLSDLEIKELYSRSRSQEEEILLLRKQNDDACVKELELLNEKHILERKLSDLRMALDEKQDDAISDALKQLNQKESRLEENLRLANDLKVTEEEVYLFTSSLLRFLAEYNIHPPVLNASTITSGTKRLYQQMYWKIRSINDSFGDTNQSGNLYNPNYQQDSRINNLRQYTQQPVDPHANQMFNQHRLIQDSIMMEMRDVVGNAPSNDLEENFAAGADPRLDPDLQFYSPSGLDNQDFSTNDEFPLPSIEGFEIIGEPKPGEKLTACGFPTNGTALCIFQWVCYLENGTRQSIEGATVPDYVVTADDVDTILAVDCTPMDNSGRQGDLVREFANNQKKITCDPEMQNELDTYISTGQAAFDVLVLADSSDEWDVAILMLRRSSYQIKLQRTDVVLIEEKYSPDIRIKVPNGLSTQFVLVSSRGITRVFNTEGITEPRSMDNDVRVRDIIVLAMRTFQHKALDGKRKGKA